MLVRMCVWLAAIPFGIMRVLVVVVMRMQVFVFQGFVFMNMFVAFAHMQPHSQRH